MRTTYLSFSKCKAVYVVVAFAFLIRSFWFLDPDFGHHLRVGQLIRATGIPTTDPFSYSMPSYPFVDHEWLTNVFISATYPLVDKMGLIIFFSLVAYLAIKISTSILGSTKNTPSTIVVLSAGALLMFFGVRAQVLSWLYLAIGLKILLGKAAWKKYWYAFPVLMLLWVNTHGSFALGIVIAFLVFVTGFIRYRTLNKKLFLILATSLTVTLINPYGIRIWWEVWQQVSDQSLKLNIAEWMPSILYPNFFYWALVAVSSYLIIRFRKNFNAETILLFVFLFFQSISSIRHIPLFAMLALPVSNLGLRKLQREFTNKISQLRFKKALRVATIGVFIMFIFQSYLSTREAYALSESNFYPVKAVQYLKTNQSSGNLFATYIWGGYLDWRLPEQKVFIDGRMPSWRRNNPPDGEAGWAFDEYLNALRSSDYFAAIAEKYDITAILWPKRPNSSVVSFLEILGYNSKEGFVERLEKAGWQQIYDDGVAIILQRK